MANKYLFASLASFGSVEGDRATSPRFSIANVVMSASRASLEALIASLLPIGGTAKEVTSPTTIKLLIAVRTFFVSANGERETSPSFTFIGTYTALL